jgi:type IV pilus assembly protein PilQ
VEDSQGKLKMISKIKRNLYVLLAILPTLAWGEVQVKDIQFASLPGDQFEIKLMFSGTPPAPKTYEIGNPARVVMDFPGVGSALSQKNMRSALKMPAMPLLLPMAVALA